LITPRVTRLLRASDLRTFQSAIVGVVPHGWDARGTAVVVPSRSAAEELRRTIEDLTLAAGRAGMAVMPDLVTRHELYARMQEHLPDCPRLLTDFDREVLLRLAAEDAEKEGVAAPFSLRPGLLAAMLTFYDELRRRGRTIDALDRIIGDRLEAGRDTDRGAERLLQQTRFLAATFAAFERRIADSGRIDEHALRTLLLSDGYRSPYRHTVLAVADQAADPRGLWPVDFDLLSRLAGLERIDVVATEAVLAAGWLQRLHDAMPDLDEERVPEESAAPLDRSSGRPEQCRRAPVLTAPPLLEGFEGPVVFVCRDREEELVEAARRIKWRARDQGPIQLERIGIVFQRPLPYLYIARQVFNAAHIPYQASDALPLAAEPFSAALDLLLTVAAEDATRAALIALLSSPHWTFHDPREADRVVGREHIAALDRLLQESKFLGGWGELARLAGVAAARSAGGSREAARWRAGEVALVAALELAPLIQRIANGVSASAQIRGMLDFVARCEAPADRASDVVERHRRARTAVIGALAALGEAHVRYDDRPRSIADLTATIHRWIEAQTFAPRAGTDGVRLLDAEAAAFARMDEIHLVGVVESDWPERTGSNIFYPVSLLRDLGWPAEADRLTSARARFGDLIMLPDRRVAVSSFTLEEDAIVSPSPFVDDVGSTGLTVERIDAGSSVRVFTHEGLSLEPVRTEVASAGAAEWLALRTTRTTQADPRYHGTVGTRDAIVYAVSRVERYLECPFKYFAGHVLQLEEEREDESGLSALERGELLHGVFESFFEAWRERGRTGVSADDLDEALALFEEIAERHLQELPEGDRALERTYLLGSAAAPGLAGRAFAVEIEQGIGVVERLLEYPFEGAFAFEGDGGTQPVRVRGKADRIDVLDDGTLRVVDYKLGRAPKPARALQLPIYGICARQRLEAARGERLPIARAGYVAFKEKNAFVDLAGKSGDIDAALREGQQRFLDAIARIEAGEYPPSPDEPWTCNRCGFPHVCRKDYVGDE
jgi:CRISPR/Cas system-associated exonuclease Cas4 (RecB family)